MLAALALAAALALKPGTIVDWDDMKAPTATYAGGGYTLELSGRKRETFRDPVVRITGPGAPPFVFRGEGGLSFASLRFGVGRVDPQSPANGVFFMDYSGGAHCCTHVRLLEPLQGRWRVVDLDSWDGEGLNDFPRDEDGDGRPDLLFYDEAFNYAFASHADSWAPHVIRNVVGGKVVDVSKSGRFARIWAAQLKEMRPECAKHSNGACAAFVAVAARLGRFDEAWSFMLKNYDRKSDWELPTACRKPAPSGACQKDAEVRFAGYPEALRWFLGEHGYMSRVPLP